MPIKIEFNVNQKPLLDAEIRPRLVAHLRQTAIETVQLLKLSKLVPVDQSILRGSFVFDVDEANLVAVIGSPKIWGIVQDEGRRKGKRMPPERDIRRWVLRKGILNKAIDDENKKRKVLKSKFSKKGRRSFQAKAATQSLSKFKAKTEGTLRDKVLLLSAKAQKKVGTRKGLEGLNLLTRAATDVANMQDSIVFLIRRSIKKKGIPGKHFYRDVRKRILPRFKKGAADAIAGRSK